MNRRTQGIKEPSLQNWLKWEKNTFRHQHLTSIVIKMAGMNLLTLQRSHQSHPTKQSHSKQKCVRACIHTHTHTQIHILHTNTYSTPHTSLKRHIYAYPKHTHIYPKDIYTCYSVTKSCPTLCDPMDCSMPGSLSFTISQSLLKLMSKISQWCYPTISTSVTLFFCL